MSRYKFFEAFEYFGQHIVTPFQHIIVPESDHAVTILVQNFGAVLVVCILLAVLAAVEFYDKAGFQTHEIDNVAGDGKLPAEFVSAQPSIAQMAPQLVLTIRGLRTQGSGSIDTAPQFHASPLLAVSFSRWREKVPRRGE